MIPGPVAADGVRAGDRRNGHVIHVILERGLGSWASFATPPMR